MSHPYLVHKDDADRYDLIVEATKDLDHLYTRRSADPELTQEKYLERVSEYARKRAEIVYKLGGEAETISYFSKQPKDRENYHVYVLGRRFYNGTYEENKKLAQYVEKRLNKLGIKLKKKRSKK